MLPLDPGAEVENFGQAVQSYVYVYVYQSNSSVITNPALQLHHFLTCTHSDVNSCPGANPLEFEGQIIQSSSNNHVYVIISPPWYPK